MSTRSMIAYQDSDSGKIYGIYCHSDGYLDHNGVILHMHYNSLELAKSIVDLGGVSYISKTLEECEFYHRDMGEDFESNAAGEFSSLAETHSAARGSYGAEYTYVFMNDKWMVSCYDRGFVPLKDALMNVNKV